MEILELLYISAENGRHIISLGKNNPFSALLPQIYNLFHKKSASNSLFGVFYQLIELVANAIHDVKTNLPASSEMNARFYKRRGEIRL